MAEFHLADLFSDTVMAYSELNEAIVKGYQ